MNSDDVKVNEQKTEIETEEYDPLTTCPTCGQELSSFDGLDVKKHHGCTTPWCPNLDPFKKDVLKDDYSLGVDDNGYPVPLTDQEFDAMLGTKERYEITQKKEYLKKINANPNITSQVPYEEGLIPKIEKYLKDKFGSDITDFKAHTLALFTVSTQMYNCNFRDQLGPGRPNLAILEIGESGITHKSPQLNAVKELVDYDGAEYDRLDSFTPSHYLKDGLKWMRDNNKEYYMNVSIEHEVSSLLKDDQQKNSYNDLAEHFCKILDGSVGSRGTNVNGRTGGFDVYQCYYGVGTPNALKMIRQSHWDQGFANRFLFLRGEPRYDVELGIFDIGNNLELNKKRDEIRNEMKYLHDINIVVFDPKYDQIYTDFRLESRTKLKNHELGMIDRLTNTYAVKQDLNILKLAVIYAASRKSLVNNQTLYPEIDDMQRAIDTTKEYIMFAGEIIQESFEGQTYQTSVSYDISGQTERLLNHIKKINERYRIISGTPQRAELDGKGPWVKVNLLLKRSHILKKDFDPLFVTLEASGTITKITATTPNGHPVEFIRIT